MIQTREIIRNGLHNAFTSLICWHDCFYLAYIEAPTHFASDRSRVVILRSQNAREWAEVARLGFPTKDIRDPKLAAMGENLFVFALSNASVDPHRYTTVVSRSADGAAWSPFELIQPEGWLFGQPRSLDGKQWFVPAHGQEYNRLALFESEDGEHWTLRATMMEKTGVDETAIEFLPDQTMLATIRFEGGGNIFGSKRSCTLITSSPPPYDRWQVPAASQVTRLDGPILFPAWGNLYAVGRYQPRLKGPFQYPGSILSKKRTALFQVFPDRLIYLSDLPSAGDTAYAGVAVRDQTLLVSYYSSPTGKDYPWLLGMLRPTSIFLAEIDLASLNELAKS
jgi:hypothetical protein